MTVLLMILGWLSLAATLVLPVTAAPQLVGVGLGCLLTVLIIQGWAR